MGFWTRTEKKVNRKYKYPETELKYIWKPKEMHQNSTYNKGGILKHWGKTDYSLEGIGDNQLVI